MSTTTEKFTIVYEDIGVLQVASLGRAGLHDVRKSNSGTAPHLILKVAPSSPESGKQHYSVSVSRTAVGELPVEIPASNGAATEGMDDWRDMRLSGPEVILTHAAEFDSATHAAAVVGNVVFGLLTQRQNSQ